MYTQVEKHKENKSRAVANSVALKENSGSSSIVIVDKRPAVKSQKNIQLMIVQTDNQKLSNKYSKGLKPTIQFYKEGENNTNISENNLFAVEGEGKGNKLYTKDNTFPKLQHVELQHGSEEKTFNDTTMKKVEAKWENEKAMNEMQCGEFSKSVTGIKEDKENDYAPVGRSLYVNNLTKEGYGWQNHFAPVIIVDNSDRGTLETAVGFDYCWFGIYGKKKGQSFRYKTQVANMLRQIGERWRDKNSEDLIILNKFKNESITDLKLDEEKYASILEELKKIEEMMNSKPEELSEKEKGITPSPETKEEKEVRLKKESEESKKKQTLVVEKIVKGDEKWMSEVDSSNASDLLKKVQSRYEKSGWFSTEAKRLKQAKTFIDSKRKKFVGTSGGNKSKSSVAIIIGGLSIACLILLASYMYKKKLPDSGV